MRFLWTGCLLGALALAQQPSPQLWGALDAGPHAVGYRSYFLQDAKRGYVFERRERGARPVLVSLWYPAEPATGAPLPYREYLTPPALSQFPVFRARLEAFLLDTVSDDLFTRKHAQLEPAQRAFLDALLAMPARARRDASPAPGRFPVVLYHSGAAGSYEDNSVLCEYLASHGYVVMTSAFQSADGVHVGNNYGGSGAAWADMTVLLAHAATLPFAGAANTAAFGHSAGAQSLLEWIGRKPPPVRAVVSLDTTLEYTPEDMPGHRQLRRKLARTAPPSIPVLIAASADRDPNFSTWDRYLPCRAELAIAHFRHNDFLLHGSLARQFSGDKAAEVRRNYEQMARVIRAFFDQSLRGDRSGWDQLLGAPPAGLRLTQRPCSEASRPGC